MKIKFKSNDDLPLGKMLNIPMCIIIVRRVFEEDGKYYPQDLYVNVCINMKNKIL